MSEPRAVAHAVEEIEDLGIVYWHVEDDRIGGFISTAYGLRTDEGLVLIDPLPLEPEAFAALGEIQAILLTSASHQRSAWRLRAEHDGELPVWAPALAQELDEEPDERYGHSMVLPGDLIAFHTPGAGPSQHSLILDDYIAFVPDLVVNPPGGEVALTPDEYLQNPIQARDTVRLLLDQSIEILCPSHGLPILDDVHGQLTAALEEAGELDDPSFVTVVPDAEEKGEPEEAEPEADEPEQDERGPGPV
jgi:glyoxylase-like metal-dependent hydrolase (beta-lactamase superfamily II)